VSALFLTSSGFRDKLPATWRVLSSVQRFDRHRGYIYMPGGLQCNQTRWLGVVNDTSLKDGGVCGLVLAYGLETSVEADLSVADEHEWVERARCGDFAAFDQIMLCYEGRLLRFLTGLVGDAEVARELCQDTFLAAYQSLPRLRGEMRLSAWLHTIALNRARSYHRRRKLRCILLFEHDSFPGSLPDVQESVATHDTVQRVLSRMPRQYSQVLLLQIASGLSCKEIADVLGSSEGAIKVRLLRAREAFRHLYEDEDRDQCPA
jgi:RNA polymerase sigma factor (sigma-70 family)